jgi:outer membrane protein
MNKKIYVSAGACILFATLSHAQNSSGDTPNFIKCGMVDGDAIMQKAQIVKNAQQKIMEEFKPRGDDLAGRSKEWRKLVYQLDVAKDEKNESRAQEIQKTLDELRPALQKDTKEFEVELTKRKKEELGKVLDTVSKVSYSFALQNGYQKLFQKSEKEPFYIAPGAARSECNETLDVTADIMNVVDKNNSPDTQALTSDADTESSNTQSQNYGPLIFNRDGGGDFYIVQSGKFVRANLNEGAIEFHLKRKNFQIGYNGEQLNICLAQKPFPEIRSDPHGFKASCLSGPMTGAANKDNDGLFVYGGTSWSDGNTELSDKTSRKAKPLAGYQLAYQVNRLEFLENPDTNISNFKGTLHGYIVVYKQSVRNNKDIMPIRLIFD